MSSVPGTLSGTFSPASLHPIVISSVFCCPSLVLQGVDVSADLERWSQFDVHAGHQVIFGQQQQRLAIDLLQAEGLGHVAAAWVEQRRKPVSTLLIRLMKLAADV